MITQRLFDPPIQPGITCRNCGQPLEAFGEVFRSLRVAGLREFMWRHAADGRVNCEIVRPAEPSDGWHATAAVVLVEKQRQEAEDAALDGTHLDVSAPGRAGRFESLLGAEHEQFDQRGELLRSVVEYMDAPSGTVSAAAPSAEPATDTVNGNPCTIYVPPEYCSDPHRCRVHRGAPRVRRRTISPADVQCFCPDCIRCGCGMWESHHGDVRDVVPAPPRSDEFGVDDWVLVDIGPVTQQRGQVVRVVRATNGSIWEYDVRVRDGNVIAAQPKHVHHDYTEASAPAPEGRGEEKPIRVYMAGDPDCPCGCASNKEPREVIESAVAQVHAALRALSGLPVDGEER